jgi:hypothetical protein
MQADNDDGKKTIHFQGTNNRYQIKKLTVDTKIPKPRKELELLNLSSVIYEGHVQNNLLQSLYEEMNNVSSNKNFINELHLVKRQIEKKIQSYKNQDIEKNRFLDSKFIDYSTVIQELLSSNLECCYCSQKMYLMYKHAREISQWTLDRIDNNIGHDRGNVVISCLSCNLKRRRTNKDAFTFTKKMQLVKQMALDSN